MSVPYFAGIKPGDRVTFRTPQGATIAGKAQRLLCFGTHVVVDIRNGFPAVVDARNYVSHKAGK